MSGLLFIMGALVGGVLALETVQMHRTNLLEFTIKLEDPPEVRFEEVNKHFNVDPQLRAPHFLDWRNRVGKIAVMCTAHRQQAYEGIGKVKHKSTKFDDFEHIGGFLTLGSQP